MKVEQRCRGLFCRLMLILSGTCSALISVKFFGKLISFLHPNRPKSVKAGPFNISSVTETISSEKSSVATLSLGNSRGNIFPYRVGKLHLPDNSGAIGFPLSNRRQLYL